MSEYQLEKGIVNLAIPVSGRFVAHTKASRIERAFHAADLVIDKTRLVKPTITQASRLWWVSRTYVAWAIKQQDNRKRIEAGLMALVPARVLALPAPMSTEIDDSQVINFVRTVGVSRVLDAAVVVEAA